MDGVPVLSKLVFWIHNATFGPPSLNPIFYMDFKDRIKIRKLWKLYQ